MVGASEVDSSSVYSTSSSSRSEDEGDWRKGRKSSKNLSGLGCFTIDGFCTMALSSGSKTSNQSDLDSDFTDDVCDELPFLRQENEQLGLLLDNRDDMLREAKKMRKALRAMLEDARVVVLTPKFGKESDSWVRFDKESVWWKEGSFQRYSAKRSAVGYLLRFGKGTVELILRDWTVTWLNRGKRMDG
jgi:hypothetical protein